MSLGRRTIDGYTECGAYLPYMKGQYARHHIRFQLALHALRVRYCEPQIPVIITSIVEPPFGPTDINQLRFDDMTNIETVMIEVQKKVEVFTWLTQRLHGPFNPANLHIQKSRSISCCW